MAASARVRIKQHPSDVWSTRERLSLACSVMRSGDQNWVSVSRAIRQFGDPNRPSDWFSQKNCALQYSELLEKVETPKRKRGEREVTETPGAIIVRKLTIERLEELKQIVQEEQAKYEKLKKEVEDIRSGALDDQLQNVIAEMEAEKAAKEEAAQKEAEEIASKRSPLKRPPALSIKTEADESTQDSTLSDAVTEDEGNISTAPSACNTPQPQVEEVHTDTKPLPSPPPPPPPPPEAPTQSILEKALQDVPVEEIVETTDMIPPVEIKEELIEVVPSAPEVEIKVEVEEEPPATPTEERPTRATSQQDSGGSLTAGVPTLTRLLGKPIATAPLSAQTLPTNQSPAPKTKSPAANQSPVSKVKSQTSKSPMAKSKVAQSPVAKIKTPEAVTESPITTRSASVSEANDGDKSDIKLRERTPSRDRKKKEPEKEEVEEKVSVEIKEDPGTDTEAVPLTPALEFEEPLSPASSVVSNESGSFRGHRGRRSRGGKRGGRGRRSTRMTRRRHPVEDDKKEEDVLSKASEVETTDDDGDGADTGGDGVLESDDTGSNVTGPRQHYSVSESQPNSPAGSLTQGSDTEDEKAHKIWKKSIMLVWRAAANHKYANVFLHAVTDDIAPGYSSVVSRPMNLQTIKKSIEAGIIRTTAEFQRDMMLMFTNAIMYNNSDHDVFNMATEMYDDVMAQLEQFVNTQMMVQVEPKLLRTLRRNDAHSDKEDSLGDSKRKRLSVAPDTPDHQGGKAKKRKP